MQHYYVQVVNRFHPRYGTIGKVIGQDPKLVVVNFGDPPGPGMKYNFLPVEEVLTFAEEGGDGVILQVPMANLPKAPSSFIQQVVNRMKRIGLVFAINEQQGMLLLKRA